MHLIRFRMICRNKKSHQKHIIKKQLLTKQELTMSENWIWRRQFLKNDLQWSKIPILKKNQISFRLRHIHIKWPEFTKMIDLHHCQWDIDKKGNMPMVSLRLLLFIYFWLEWLKNRPLTKTLWNFENWVIEIVIADWKGHNHPPDWSFLIGSVKIFKVKKCLISSINLRSLITCGHL